MVRIFALSVGLVAIVGVGCSADRASDEGSTTSVAHDTVTEPTTTTGAAPEAASQTIAEAHRDGVIADVAALRIADRVEMHESIDAAEGTWGLSRLTETANALAADGGCSLGNVSGVYGIDWICTYEYGEALLLDDHGEIVRAYPMPGAVPSWIYLTTDAVYGGRIGDGGLPSSTLVRIDRQTLAAQVIVFPQPDSPGPWPPGWRIATDDEVATYSTLVRIGPEETGTVAVSETGHVVIDEAGLERLFGPQ